MRWAVLVWNEALGGIIVIWDRRDVKLIEEYVGQYLGACHFKNVYDSFEWGFASICGPNFDSSRRLLWDEMQVFG